MKEMGDDELRSRFAGLRGADEARQPDFRSVLERAVLRAPHSSRIAWRSPLRVAVSLAAAAAVVLAVGLTMQSRKRRAFVPVNLSIWTSPTASLLRTPGSELLTSATLGPSIIDPPVSQTHTRTGKKK
jgi:hypothetical protein